MTKEQQDIVLKRLKEFDDKRHYCCENILKEKANYNILLGQRSNGKSYKIKVYTLLCAYHSNDTFVYLRRLKEDIKTTLALSYFGDAPIKKITKGEYETITFYRGFYYFANIDDQGKVINKSRPIGRACSLVEQERYKSNAFMNEENNTYVSNIIYEEFVTDGRYIPREPEKLKHFVSTVSREQDCRVWLIGNTISRINPYFYTWCLDRIPKQKQGTIDNYFFHSTETINGEEIEKTSKISVEYCANIGSGKSTMFFGTTQKAIVSGTWETQEYPKLPRHYNEYSIAYKISVQEMGFKFLMELLTDCDGNCILYVRPQKGDKVDRVITRKFNESFLVTKKLDNSRRAEQVIYRLYQLDKICYCDNLCGTDFNHCLKEMGGLQIC